MTLSARTVDFRQRAVSYQRCFRETRTREQVFGQMVMDDMSSFDNPVVLDIGCGHGFDANHKLQKRIAESAAKFVGVEPDREIQLGSHVDEAHHCLFEDADIAPGSVDVAYAVMVLEHIEDPRAFWSKLNHVLADGGVFWGFTMDRRHYFTWASQITESLKLKDWILGSLHGKRGEERYENYETFYRANHPHTVRHHLRQSGIQRFDWISMNRIGQLDFYVPKQMRWLSHAFDRVEQAFNLPGSILAMRAEKTRFERKVRRLDSAHEFFENPSTNSNP